MSGERRPRLFYGYVLAFSGFVLLLCMYGALYSFGVFLTPLTSGQHLPAASVAGAYSLCFFLSGALAVAAGRLNDRIGPRLVISCAGVLIASGYFLLSRVETIAGLYLYYGLIGLGMSAVLTPVLSTIANWFVARRGAMTGFAVSGVGTGTFLAPPLVNGLISAYGWRTSFFLMGIIVLVVVVGLAQLFSREPSRRGLRPYGAEEGGSPASDGDGLSLRDACRSSQLWILFTLYISAGFIIQITLVNSTSYAMSLGVSPAWGAAVLSVIGLGSLAGRIFGGTASDRFGSKPMIVTATLVMAVQYALLLTPAPFWTVFACAGLFGLAYGEILCMMPLLPAELFGLRNHGAIMGIVTFGSTIGGGLGPVAAGAIMDGFGDYRILWVACVIVSIMALLLSVRIGKPGHGRRVETPGPVEEQRVSHSW